MQPMTRRQLLHTAAGAALALSPLRVLAAEEKKAGYTLPKLPYDYNALEPSIDETTMKIHHDKHHQAYVDNLNKFLSMAPELYGQPIEDVLRNIGKVPEKIRQAVINNGGGHANHTMFWEIMGPDAGGKPAGPLAKAIDDAFGGFAALQKKIKDCAMARFGSGWAWLVVSDGKLEILSTSNQDSPLMKGQTPLLGIDVWEHAYYLKYQNKRADYVDAWWKVVNWSNVAKRYEQAQKS